VDCPVCRDPLIVVERQGIELDYCPRCKGFWFDADELKLLAEALHLEVALPDVASLPKVEAKEKPRRCPRCRKQMDKIHLGTEPRVLVDRCPAGDGLWFDAGELSGVLEQGRKDGATGEQHVIYFLGETFGSGKQRPQASRKAKGGTQ